MTDRVKGCDVGCIVGGGYSSCRRDATVTLRKVGDGSPFNFCGWHAVKVLVGWVNDDY